MEYVVQQKIDILSKMYNYFDGKKAIKIIFSMTEEESKIVLLNSNVQDTIFKIDDVDILREIFRKSPSFFQEIMFSNEKTQDLLITPRKTLDRKKLINNYNDNIVFNEKEIRELEVFLHTIKSPKIYEQIVDSKFFQRIVPMFREKQIKKSFFEGMDVVKLFNNIVNDDEIFNTKKARQKNILEVFNKVSNHILLPDNYNSIIGDGKNFILTKKWECENDEMVYIDDRTLSLLTTPMLDELLKFENVDNEYIKSYLKKDLFSKLIKNNYTFDKIFPHLLTGDYNCFNSIDYIYFNLIIENFDGNETLKENFITFIYNILCNNQNFDLIEKIKIKEILYNKIKNMEISKEQYKNLFYCPSELKTIFYLKFGKLSRRMDYLNGISPKQLIYLNIKHINQILNSLNLENEDELSNLYSYAIKLYMVFGLERTLNILNGYYGSINTSFFDNVSNLNVENVKLVKEGKKYIPKISDEFIGFMFASQNQNHFKNMLSEPSSLLCKNWSYSYNNYEKIKEECHGTITLKKLNVILRELSPEREIEDVSPNNYKLRENDILNDICLGNKTRKSNQEVYKMVLDIYEKMKRRVESSIPYVEGEASNGYFYEMMKLNDPIVFTLGYKGNCCIRVNDIAHNHLLHATLCRNGRILLVFDELHQLAGFVPLKRNGELLIANSIECLHKVRNENAILAFKEAIYDIVKTSKSNERDSIKLVCIGREAYAKPNGIPFPNDIPTPTIYEKDDPIYTHTDQYHKTLDIIYKNPLLNLSIIKYGNPTCSYTDPRPQISSCDFRCGNNEKTEQALKIINAVRYENADLEKLANFTLCRKYGLDKCIYNEDWYIVTTYDGKIYGDFLKFNKKTETEFKIAFEQIIGMNYDDYKEKNGNENNLSLQRKY